MPIIFLGIVLSSNANAKEHHKTVITHTNKTFVLPVKQIKVNNKLEGTASWYGYESGPHYRSRPKTANGEFFNPQKFTAAHKKLPFGTRVKVTNLKNNQSVIVVINDRGPYVKGRIIDLSKHAAQSIGMDGIGKVSLTVLSDV